MSEEEKKAIVELKHFSNLSAYWKEEEYTNSETDNYVKSVLNLIEKQQSVINEMAKQLAGLTIWNTEKDEPLILGSIEETIDYFTKKVDEENE